MTIFISNGRLGVDCSNIEATLCESMAEAEAVLSTRAGAVVSVDITPDELRQLERVLRQRGLIE